MVEIRPAVRDDVPTITAINIRGWQAAFRDLFPQAFLDQLNPERKAPAVYQMIDQGAPNYLAVAEENGAVVGYVIVGPARSHDLDPSEVSELYSIYIEPDRIGTGLGRELMGHALQFLRSSGWRASILWTLEDLHRTTRFYEKAGWSLDGAETVNEIPEGNPLVHVRYRIDL